MRKRRKDFIKLFLLCFFLANGVCEGRKTFPPSSGEFQIENRAEDNSEEKTDSNNGSPKVEDHGGAFAQRGSDSRAHSLRNGQHFGVASTGPRWNNLARDFGPQIEDKRRMRMKKKKKQAFERDEERKEHDPERTGRTKHTAQRATSRGMVFPIIFAAVSAGFLMLVCIVAAFAQICKSYSKKCCRQAEDVELGLKDPSLSNNSGKDVNEEVSLEEIVIQNDTDQSAESSKQTKPLSAENAAKETNNNDHGTSTIAESSSKDAKIEESCTIIEIHETDFPDSSKTCASLADELTERECCGRFSSLTAVAPSSSPSDLGSDNAIVIEPQRSDSASTASDRSTAAISSSPKKSSTSDVSSSSGGELTGTAFTTTDNSADSSTQSCKVPVAPVDEIVVSIEDDYDDGKVNQSRESVTTRDRIDGSENMGKGEETIIIPSEIVKESKSGISQEVKGGSYRPRKACSDDEEGAGGIVGKTVEKPLLNEHDVSFFTVNDETKSGEDRPDEIKGGSEGFKSTLKDHTESPQMQEKVTEKVETKQTDKCVGATEDYEKASVMKALMDAIGEFVIIDNYVVPLSALDSCKELFPNESHNKPDYHTCETQPIIDDFEAYEPDIPDKNAIKGTPWEQEEFGIRGGSKGGPFKNRTRTKEGDQLNTVDEIQRSPSIRNISSKISGFDHVKNPQVGCSCSFCENHWRKTQSPRYLKVPRKLVNSSATSSKSELTYEMALKGQLPSSPKSGSSGIDDADCNLGCGENSTDSPVG